MIMMRDKTVVRKMLLTPEVAEDSQRNRLFRTRYTKNKSMFDLIIDSGSYENIIVKYTADQLKLPLEPHPEPYKIGLIKSTEEITVN
jgi:hypothetical protein